MCPHYYVCHTIIIVHKYLLLHVVHPCKIQDLCYPNFLFYLIYIFYDIMFLFPFLNKSLAFIRHCVYKAYELHRLSLRANTRCGS